MHPVAKLSDLQDGQTIKFTISRPKTRIHGFLARIQGHLAAYENRCCHHPVALDDDKGVFLAPDRNAIRCIHHSALFNPLTGLCVRGPCLGDRLRPIPFQVMGDTIFVLPEEFPG